MTRRLLPAAALVALALVIAPETSRGENMTGWASAYAPGRFEEVVAYRLENRLWRNTPPSEWIYADGYIATNNCSQVGRMAWLVDPAGNEYRVLIGDCAGHDSTRWMTENGIAAELDWRLWERLTTEHGKPLRVGINDRD
jgi:hypothetical protein